MLTCHDRLVHSSLFLKVCCWDVRFQKSRKWSLISSLCFLMSNLWSLCSSCWSVKLNDRVQVVLYAVTQTNLSWDVRSHQSGCRGRAAPCVVCLKRRRWDERLQQWVCCGLLVLCVLFQRESCSRFRFQHLAWWFALSSGCGPPVRSSVFRPILWSNVWFHRLSDRGRFWPVFVTLLIVTWCAGSLMSLLWSLSSMLWLSVTACRGLLVPCAVLRRAPSWGDRFQKSTCCDLRVSLSWVSRFQQSACCGLLLPSPVMLWVPSWGVQFQPSVCRGPAWPSVWIVWILAQFWCGSILTRTKLSWGARFQLSSFRCLSVIRSTLLWASCSSLLIRPRVSSNARFQPTNRRVLPFLWLLLQRAAWPVFLLLRVQQPLPFRGPVFRLRLLPLLLPFLWLNVLLQLFLSLIGRLLLSHAPNDLLQLSREQVFLPLLLLQHQLFLWLIGRLQLFLLLIGRPLLLRVRLCLWGFRGQPWRQRVV